MCKSDTKNESVETETESLSTMSLLELPIITDIGHDENVSKLIVTTHNNPSTSSANTAAEPLVDANFMIIGHETEIDLAESSNIKNDVNHPSGAEHSILWGCKQCDFRFVKIYSY